MNSSPKFIHLKVDNYVIYFRYLLNVILQLPYKIHLNIMT